MAEVKLSPGRFRRLRSGARLLLRGAVLAFVASLLLVGVVTPSAADAGVVLGIGAPGVVPTGSASGTPSATPTPTPTPSVTASVAPDPVATLAPVVPVPSVSASVPPPVAVAGGQDPAAPVPQVLAVPAGGIDAGGGSTARSHDGGLLALSGGLLSAGVLLLLVRWRRVRG